MEHLRRNGFVKDSENSKNIIFQEPLRYAFSKQELIHENRVYKSIMDVGLQTSSVFVTNLNRYLTRRTCSFICYFSLFSFYHFILKNVYKRVLEHRTLKCFTAVVFEKVSLIHLKLLIHLPSYASLLADGLQL